MTWVVCRRTEELSLWINNKIFGKCFYVILPHHFVFLIKEKCPVEVLICTQIVLHITIVIIFTDKYKINFLSILFIESRKHFHLTGRGAAGRFEKSNIHVFTSEIKYTAYISL